MSPLQHPEMSKCGPPDRHTPSGAILPFLSTPCPVSPMSPQCAVGHRWAGHPTGEDVAHVPDHAGQGARGAGGLAHLCGGEGGAVRPCPKRVPEGHGEFPGWPFPVPPALIYQGRTWKKM